MLHSVYYIAKHAGPIQFIPGDQSVLFNGMTISLSSEQAISICYSDATNTPQCTSNGAGCLVGTRLIGSSGITGQLTEDVTLRAVGCADTTTTPVGGSHSAMKESSYIISSTVPNDSNEDDFSFLCRFIH